MIRKLMSAIVLCAFCVSCEDPSVVAGRNRASAGKIVMALQAYHQAHQVYPRRLEELVPEFLPRLLPPEECENGTWYYVPNEDRSQFNLAYKGRGSHYTGGYESRRDFWYEDSK